MFYISYNRYEESTVKNNYIGFLSSTLNYQDRCSEQRRHFCCFWPYSKGNTFSAHQRSRPPSILYKCSTVYYNTVYERCWHISCELSSSQGWKTELRLRQISRERIFEKEVLKNKLDIGASLDVHELCSHLLHIFQHPVNITFYNIVSSRYSIMRCYSSHKHRLYLFLTEKVSKNWTSLQQ